MKRGRSNSPKKPPPKRHNLLAIKKTVNAIPPETRKAVVPEPSTPRIRCPYLDTINRNVCDFDVAKECSISLRKQHVYMCLVCGTIFHGRGKNTFAYTHSVQAGHHVFLNLHSEKFYCLPDLYEIVDSSLDDIRLALNPVFTSNDMNNLDTKTSLSKDVFGVSYLPGYIGLNNLSSTDYINVVLHALAHVKPLRNFFLDATNYQGCTDPLVVMYGELMRKIWSSFSFKNIVAPHDFVNAVVKQSKKRFQVGTQGASAEFLIWLLTSLHRGLGKGTGKNGKDLSRRKRESSIITQTFQGIVEVRTEPLLVKETIENSKSNGHAEEISNISVQKSPFLVLSVDLPAMPLFKDSEGSNVIPHVQLMQVLQKFSGQKHTDFVLKKIRRRYELLELPPYLIVCLKRFTKNNFFTEKNSTIVNFPVINLDMKTFVKDSENDLQSKISDVLLPSVDVIRNMSVANLKGLLDSLQVIHKDIVEKRELILRCEESVSEERKLRTLRSKYDLTANIVHDSPPAEDSKIQGKGDAIGDGNYRVHIFHEATSQWYEIEDLRVKEILPQLMSISESYILMYKRKA